MLNGALRPELSINDDALKPLSQAPDNIGSTIRNRPTMTDATIAYAEPDLVAIDIAKARHEVLMAVPGKKRRRRLTVLNQLDDFERLITTLSDYERPVSAAFDATGNYHRALA